MNLMEVFVKIGADLDGLDKGIKTARSKLSSLGRFAGKTIKSVAKVTAAVGTATGVAVGKIVKDSIAAYGEYEQLAGGIKLSLGDAYDFVADKAKTAYKDVQMSQIEYMRQVNLLSTGLKESLNGDAQAAAELSDKIIKAQADIVAAKGVSQESVENAFMGIMRGNFTMLDNLGIGIKGSQEGMKDVIDKVNEQKGTNYQLGNLADMQNALTDYVELVGLSGYASAEASDTIQGSMASVKAAWQDVLVAMGDKDADVGAKFDNFFDMLFGDGDKNKGLIENVMPIVESALKAIGGLLREKLPGAIKRLGTLLKENAPAFFDAVKEIVKSLWTVISENLPPLLEKAIEWLTQHSGEMGEAIGTFLGDAAAVVVPQIPTILGSLLDAAILAFTGIFDALDDKIPGLGFLVEALTGVVVVAIATWKAYQLAMSISGIIQTVKNGITALTTAVQSSTVAQNLLNAAQAAAPYMLLIAGITALVAGITWLWKHCEGFRNFIIGVWETIKGAFNLLIGAISQGIKDIIGFFTDLWNNLVGMFEGLIDFAGGVCKAIGGFFKGIWDNMVQSVEWVIGKIKELIGWIKDAIEAMNPLKSFNTAGAANKLEEQVKAAGGDTSLIDSYKKKYKINSPSKVFHDEVGYWMGAGISEGIEDGLADGMASGWDKKLSNADIGDIGLNYKPTDTIANTSVDQFSEMMNNQKTVIPVYIGQDRIDEIVVEANKRVNYATGGR